ncbi:MAG TPA: hypothetical protein VF199_00170 [Bacillales bacterium]
MEREKVERLRTMLQEAIQPVIKRLDQLEQEVKALREEQQTKT